MIRIQGSSIYAIILNQARSRYIKKIKKLSTSKTRKGEEQRNLIIRVCVIIKTNEQPTCFGINEPARIALYLADEVFYPPDPKRERNSRLKSAASEPAGQTKGIVIPASVSSCILSPRKKRDRGRRKR